MKATEMMKLRKGDFVKSKKDGKQLVFERLCKAWDGVPPNTSREHYEAVCYSQERPNDFIYLEAKEICKA